MLSKADIEQVLGPDVSDQLIAGIIETGGSLNDLEVALQWMSSRDEAMGKTFHPLIGPAIRIYELLLTEQWDADREGP